MTIGTTPTPLYTQDLILATVLQLHGCPPHTELEGRFVTFRFERTPALAAVLDDFERGVLRLDAKMFALLYKDVMSRVRMLQREKDWRLKLQPPQEAQP